MTSERSLDGSTYVARPVARTEPHLAMLPWVVAGVQTQFENIRSSRVWTEFDTDVFPVTAYKHGGLIEKMPLLASSQRGTIRSILQAVPLLRSHYDAVLTQVAVPLVPLFAACAARRKRVPPIVYTVDATPRLMDGFHAIYYGTPGAGPRKRAIRDRLHRYAFDRCSFVVPWSQWAARSFSADYSVPEERLRVIPPGVNLREWAVPHHRRVAVEDSESPFRLLFVGADFERKGGRLLLEVFREQFSHACDLHIVTKADVPEGGGIRVYRTLSPNDPELRALYERCDALVLPTRADCFSLASIEAMACGLPVITCPVGGIPEIVRDGSTGHLVPPDDGMTLANAIRHLAENRRQSVAMGLEGRRVVEQRFDSEKTSCALFSLLHELTGAVSLKRQGSNQVQEEGLCE